MKRAARIASASLAVVTALGTSGCWATVTDYPYFSSSHRVSGKFDFARYSAFHVAVEAIEMDIVEGIEAAVIEGLVALGLEHVGAPKSDAASVMFIEMSDKPFNTDTPPQVNGEPQPIDYFLSVRARNSSGRFLWKLGLQAGSKSVGEWKQYALDEVAKRVASLAEPNPVIEAAHKMLEAPEQRGR